mmetsp:Transcript_13575/g.30799  ORF Transcript_13575/g.30799 Transcript_13575/m.30799 type:complete len:86 (-) Transcript_13575:113-370(-)
MRPRISYVTSPARPPTHPRSGKTSCPSPAMPVCAPKPLACRPIFTKALDRVPFFKFRQILFNVVNPTASFLRLIGGVFLKPLSAR